VDGMTEYDIGIETDPGHFAVFTQVTALRGHGSYEIPADAPAGRGYCVRAVKGNDVGDWSDLYYIPGLKVKKTPVAAATETQEEDIEDDGPSRFSLFMQAIRYYGRSLLVWILVVVLTLLAIWACNWAYNHVSFGGNQKSAATNSHAQEGALAANSGTSLEQTAKLMGKSFKTTPDRVVTVPYDGYISGQGIPESLIPGEDVAFKIAPGWDLFPTVNNGAADKCLIAYDDVVLSEETLAKIPLIQKVDTFRVRSYDPTNMITLTFVLTTPPKGSFRANGS
jgi:hypothetical protein